MLVIVPAWNEETTLAAVVEETRAALLASAVPADILVVDDGSDDATGAVATASGALVAHLPVNLGVGGAMRTGYRYAQRLGYAVTVQVDADGQHNPADIPALLDALADGADIVIGARVAGDGAYLARGPRRWAMSMLSGTISRIAHTKLTDTTSGFKACGPRAIDLFARSYPAEYLGDTVESLVVAARSQLVIRRGGRRHAAPGRWPAVARTGPLRGVPRPRRPRARAGAHPAAAGAARQPAPAVRGAGRMMLLSQSGYPFALVVAAALLVALFWLLRTQRLREKYSVLWFAVIVGVVLLTFIPAITGWLTALAGVTTPINLVFILAFLVLLVVCIQLSIEISTLEESARTVAEEVALLRLELERRTGGADGTPPHGLRGVRAADGRLLRGPLTRFVLWTDWS